MLFQRNRPHLTPTLPPDPTNHTHTHSTLQPTTPKTIVLYNSGGFGDAIMYNRFIAPLADKYHNHRIICLIDKKLFWLFNSADFACKENVVLISEEDLKTLTEETLKSKYNITHIDYQCDIMMLAYFMNLSYNDIPATFNTYLFKEINLINTRKPNIITPL